MKPVIKIVIGAVAGYAGGAAVRALLGDANGSTSENEGEPKRVQWTEGATTISQSGISFMDRFVAALSHPLPPTRDANKYFQTNTKNPISPQPIGTAVGALAAWKLWK
jgi:hypothetical protein